MKLGFKNRRPEVGQILTLRDIKELRKEIRKELTLKEAKKQIYTSISKGVTVVLIGKYRFIRRGFSSKLESNRFETIKVL